MCQQHLLSLSKYPNLKGKNLLSPSEQTGRYVVTKGSLGFKVPTWKQIGNCCPESPERWMWWPWNERKRKLCPCWKDRKESHQGSTKQKGEIRKAAENRTVHPLSGLVSSEPQGHVFLAERVSSGAGWGGGGGDLGGF